MVTLRHNYPLNLKCLKPLQMLSQIRLVNWTSVFLHHDLFCPYPKFSTISSTLELKWEEVPVFVFNGSEFSGVEIWSYPE